MTVEGKTLAEIENQSNLPDKCAFTITICYSNDAIMIIIISITITAWIFQIRN